MELLEAITLRHSVRSYLDRPIQGEVLEKLRAEIAACNAAGGLHIQLVLDEPEAFDTRLARYGKFVNVRNYLALAGPKGPDLEERCGYYGERLVLESQRLGLNTCWVGLTYKKRPEALDLAPGEKLVLVIAIGYGTELGKYHTSKAPEQVAMAAGPAPDWFWRGVDAALLAPTAMNQQRFRFAWRGGKVYAWAGVGFWTKTDLGIAKYHFEAGAAPQTVVWG